MERVVNNESNQSSSDFSFPAAFDEIPVEKKTVLTVSKVFRF